MEDPRPDLVEDAARWRRLLTLAAPIDAHRSGGLTGLLRAFRCEGAVLTDGTDTYRLWPGPVISRSLLRELVGDGGHGALLTDLLARSADPTEVATQVPLALAAEWRPTRPQGYGMESTDLKSGPNGKRSRR